MTDTLKEVVDEIIAREKRDGRSPLECISKAMITLNGNTYLISLLYRNNTVNRSGKGYSPEYWSVRLSKLGTSISQGQMFNTESDAVDYYQTQCEKLMQKEIVL